MKVKEAIEYSIISRPEKRKPAEVAFKLWEQLKGENLTAKEMKSVLFYLGRLEFEARQNAAKAR